MVWRSPVEASRWPKNEPSRGRVELSLRIRGWSKRTQIPEIALERIKILNTVNVVNLYAVTPFEYRQSSTWVGV